MVFSYLWIINWSLIMIIYMFLHAILFFIFYKYNIFCDYNHNHRWWGFKHGWKVFEGNKSWRLWWTNCQSWPWSYIEQAGNRERSSCREKRMRKSEMLSIIYIYIIFQNNIYSLQNLTFILYIQKHVFWMEEMRRKKKLFVCVYVSS